MARSRFRAAMRSPANVIFRSRRQPSVKLRSHTVSSCQGATRIGHTLTVSDRTPGPPDRARVATIDGVPKLTADSISIQSRDRPPNCIVTPCCDEKDSSWPAAMMAAAASGIKWRRVNVQFIAGLGDPSSSSGSYVRRSISSRSRCHIALPPRPPASPLLFSQSVSQSVSASAPRT
jgi:hypothetical protein